MASVTQHAASQQEADRPRLSSPVLFDRLDVLRAIAVSMVFLDHASEAFGYPSLVLRKYTELGRMGVFFFFVHTSLVLMFSLERQRAKTGRDRMWSIFMTRRAFRIYPLSMLVLTIVVLFRIPSRDVAAHTVAYVPPDLLAYLSNLFLVQNAVHSSVGASSILGVLWTLPLEVQMYVFLPLLFLLAPRLKSVAALTAAWVGVLVLSVVWGFLMLRDVDILWSGSWGYVSLPDVLVYAPAFFAGVIAYRRWRLRRPWLPFWTLPVLIVGIILYQLALHTYIGLGSTFLMYPEFLACLALGLLLPLIREPKAAWVSAIAGPMAKYSYSIYLVHVPCIWVGFAVLSGLPFVLEFAVTVGLTAVLSVALFHLVERPFIVLGVRLSERLSTRQSLVPRSADGV